MGSPNNPLGNQSLFGVSVDLSTGEAKIQNFWDLVKKVQRDTQQGSQASQQQIEQEAGGWAALAAKTWLASEAIEGYTRAVIGSIAQSTQLAARVEVLNTVMAITARNMNYSTGAVNAQVEAIRKLNITKKEATDTTIQFMRAQLNLADATKLARAAQDLAVVSGENSAQALNTLMTAIQNQYTMLLKGYGIIKQQDQIYSEYAARIGKTAGALTEFEKRQAFVNTILTEARKVSGAYITSMDDAGKKVTSLSRIWEDMQVAIGKNFIPVMNVLIDILMVTGEVVTSLAEKWPKLVSSVAIFITTAAGMGAVVASLKAVEAGLIAVGMAGGFATTSVQFLTASAGRFFLIVGVITALAAAFKIMADHAAEFKSTLESGRLLQGEAEQARNLNKELTEYVQKQKELADIESGRRSLAAGKTANFYGGKLDSEVQLAAKKNDLRMREEQIIGDIRLLVADTTGWIEKQADGSEKLVATAEMLATLEKRKRDEAEKMTPVLEGQLASRKKEYQEELQRLQRMQEARAKGANLELIMARGLWRTLTSDASHWRNSQQAIEEQIKLVGELGKSWKSAEQQVADYKRQIEGGQIVPADFDAIAQGFQKVAAKLALLRQAQQSGFKVPTEQVSAAQDQLRNSTAWYTDQIKNLENAKKSLEGQNKKETTDYRLLDAEQKKLNESLKATTTLMQGRGTDDSKLQGVVTRTLTDAARMNTMAVALKDTKLDVRAGEEAINSLLGVGNQLQGVRNEGAQRELQARQQAAQFEQQRIQARRQTWEDTQRLLELERQSSYMQAEGMVIADRRNGNLAKSLRLQADLLLTLRKQREEQDRALELSRLMIDVDQTRAQAVGATEQEELAFIDKRFQQEVKTIEASSKFWFVKFQEMRLAEARANGQKIEIAARWKSIHAQEAQEYIRTQMEIFDADHWTAKSRYSDADQYAKLIERNAEAQIDALKADNNLRKQYAGDMEAYERMITDRSTAYRKSAELAVRNFRIQVEEAALSESNEIQTVYDRTAMIAGEITQNEFERLQAYMQLNLEAARLKVLLGEQNAELKRYLELRGKAIETEAKLRDFQKYTPGGNESMQAAYQGLQIAKEYGASSEALNKVMATFDPQTKMMQQRFKDLNDALKEGTISITEYTNAWRDLTNQPVTFTDALTRAMDTVEGNVTKLDMLKGSADLVSNAFGQAWEAMLNGENAGQALKKALADQLKTMSKQFLVNAIAHTAYGIAALTPWGAAVYGPAAMQFKSAAMFAAAAAAAGSAGAAMGGGMSGGGGSNGQPQSPNAVGTRTALEDNMVRLEAAIVRNGRVLVEANAPLKNLSTQFIESIQSGQLYQPITQAVNQGLSSQLAEVARSQEGQTATSQQILAKIHQELVKSNEKDMNVVVNNETILDSGTMSELMDTGFVRGTQRYPRELAAAQKSASDQNVGRRDIGNNLFNGGV